MRPGHQGTVLPAVSWPSAAARLGDCSYQNNSLLDNVGSFFSVPPNGPCGKQPCPELILNWVLRQKIQDNDIRNLSFENSASEMYDEKCTGLFIYLWSRILSHLNMESGCFVLSRLQTDKRCGLKKIRLWGILLSLK